MLTERERRLLAQIETNLHRDEPALANLLKHGPRRGVIPVFIPSLGSRPVGRRLRLRRPGPAATLGLIFTAITMLMGLTLFSIGLDFSSPSLIAGGLAVTMVLPLPVWLVTSSTRWLAGLGLRPA